MPVVQAHSAAEFAAAAADWIAAHLDVNPRSVLALPTGSTPVGLYAELAARARAGTSSLGQARIFNLDEFCGLGRTDPNSYAAFMDAHVIGPLRLAAEQVCLLRGDAGNYQEECARYDAQLAACGGIDLCLLGLGANGHIAFNEPGCAWDERTHVVRLSQATRAAQGSSAAPGWEVPRFGMTMGIATLLESRHVLLLIAGANKDAARAALHRGVEDGAWPVTSLLRHPSVTVIELGAPAAPP